MHGVRSKFAALLPAVALTLHAQDRLPYTTYTSFSQVLEGSGVRYLPVTRVSDPGTAANPIYTGFFFYQCSRLHRVDLHPRFSRDGKTVSIDSTHESLGRQMYVLDISAILDNPPSPPRTGSDAYNRRHAVLTTR